MDDLPFDGSAAWRARRTLKDGTVVTIRGIVPADREELRREFDRSSLRTRYLRFFTARSALTEAALDYLTNVDQKSHVAIVATVESPDLKSERGVGVARFIAVEDGAAEAAITVIDDMQQKGLGTALANELARAAKLRGFRTLRAEVLADNAQMRAILESAGAKAGPQNGATIPYDITLERSFVDVLRGAAKTTAIAIRNLALPTTDDREPEGGDGEGKEGTSGGW